MPRLYRKYQLIRKPKLQRKIRLKRLYELYLKQPKKKKIKGYLV